MTRGTMEVAVAVEGGDKSTAQIPPLLLKILVWPTPPRGYPQKSVDGT